jgi:hypothetical protein
MPSFTCTTFNGRRIKAVIVSDLCLQSYPCQHGVAIQLVDGSTVYLGRFSSPTIHDLCAFLNVSVPPNAEYADNCYVAEDFDAIVDLLERECLHEYPDDILQHLAETAPSGCHHYDMWREGEEDTSFARLENNQCAFCANELGDTGHCCDCCDQVEE